MISVMEFVQIVGPRELFAQVVGDYAESPFAKEATQRLQHLHGNRS